ncbi:MAG TPA: TonB family protein [Sphingomicrobium sp.]|nr:TonB family protein [Sphingomicrobium sp.]
MTLTDSKSRLKAMIAAIAVTAILGAGILAGLNVEMVGRAIERLQTFDITMPEVPPPPPPPPERAQQDEGAPAAPEASPVVAPEPELEVPTTNPIAAAPEPGEGASSSAGQGGAGTGTGAGGTGAGSGAGFTPARRIAKIPDSEYRRLVRTSGMRRGMVGITVRVQPDGRPTNCRIVRSSGKPSVDQLMCRLTERHVRFRPALDPQGRPVAQDVSWYPDWSPR